MKKHAIMFGCSVLLTASLLAGCSSNVNKETTAASTVEATTAAGAAADTTAAGTTGAEGTTASAQAGTDAVSEATTTLEEGQLSTGFAVITSIAKSTDAGDEDGLAEVDSTAVALTMDADGKIVECKIDAVQSKINFDKTGKLTTDIATTFKSKNELGEEYGLKKASKIGLEWNEQAAAFAKYAQGKTIDEIKGIAVSAEGVPTDADLAASVTVHIGDFVNAIEKASQNMQVLGAKEGDKLGMGIVTDMEKSADAAADAPGAAQAYSTYTVVTVDADGKITSCIIDASQTNVNFDTTGKLTSDLSAPIQSKDELKEGYGMKKASKIGKEWYEQAYAFAEYAIGKTADEISGLSIDESEGAPTDADLAASVTIGIGGFQDTINKAVADAK